LIWLRKKKTEFLGLPTDLKTLPPSPSDDEGEEESVSPSQKLSVSGELAENFLGLSLGVLGYTRSSQSVQLLQFLNYTIDILFGYITYSLSPTLFIDSFGFLTHSAHATHWHNVGHLEPQLLSWS
jgi:hypothetical protein